MGRRKRKRNDADASSPPVTTAESVAKATTTTTTTTTTASDTTTLKTPPKDPASNLTSPSENNPLPANNNSSSNNNNNAKKRKKNKWITKLKQKISKAKLAAKTILRSASASAATATNSYQPRTKKPKTTISQPPTPNKKRKSPPNPLLPQRQRPWTRRKHHHHHLAYWIESCKETPPKDGVPRGPMTVVITRSYAGVTTTIRSSKDVISSFVGTYGGGGDEDATGNDTDDEQPFVHVIRAPSAKIDKTIDDGRGIVGNDLRIPNPHPPSEVPDKYWVQRHKLFSLFDDGVKLDKESWYSVTPEDIATHIAARMVDCCDHVASSPTTGRAGKGTVVGTNNRRGLVVLDAFCGCGGNAIAFARRDDISLVVGVDIDRNKLRMAAHNASLYGVPSGKLIFVETDAINVLKRLYLDGKRIDGCERSKCAAREKVKGGYKIGTVDLLPAEIDAIFLSPPWGGMDYEKVGAGDYCLAKCVKIHAHSNDDREVLDDDSEPAVLDAVDGDTLLQIAAKAARNKQVVYFLPRNTNGVSVGRSALKAGYRGYIEMEQNMLPSGKLKTITAYLNGSSSFNNGLVKGMPSKSTNKVEDTIKSGKNSSSSSNIKNYNSLEEDAITIKTDNTKREKMKNLKPNGIGPVTLNKLDDSNTGNKVELSKSTMDKVEDTAMKLSTNSHGNSSCSSTSTSSDDSSSEEDSATIKTAGSTENEEPKSPKRNGIGLVTLNISDDSSTSDNSSSSEDESSTTKRNEGKIIEIEPATVLDLSVSSSSSSEEDESSPVKRATAMENKSRTATTIADLISNGSSKKSTPKKEDHVISNNRSMLYVSSPSSSDSGTEDNDCCGEK